MWQTSLFLFFHRPELSTGPHHCKGEWEICPFHMLKRKCIVPTPSRPSVHLLSSSGLFWGRDGSSSLKFRELPLEVPSLCDPPPTPKTHADGSFSSSLTSRFNLLVPNLGLEKWLNLTSLFDLNPLGCVVPSHEPFIHCGAFPALLEALTHCPKASWTAHLLLLLPILQTHS